MKKELKIEGMSCGHCVMHVEKALKELKEVENVEVSLEGKNAIVTLKDKTDDAKLKETVEEAGYDVVEIKDI